jgi:hypothetical protein
MNISMKRIKGYVKDIIKVAVIASVVGLALSMIISFIELLMHGVNIIKILEGIRMVLLIVGSLGLLLWALFVIKKKNKELLKHEGQWRARFSEFKFAAVLFVFSTIVLLYGILCDLVLFNSL